MRRPFSSRMRPLRIRNSLSATSGREKTSSRNTAAGMTQTSPRVSALTFADRLRAPVLIVHGLEDANAATHPDQAADLYRAIVATSGTAQLVLLPREEHSFRYRETQQRLGRIHRDWLERAAAARDDSDDDGRRPPAQRAGAVTSNAR